MKHHPLAPHELARWLSELIALPSVSGNEQVALDFVETSFAPLCPEVCQRSFPESLVDHDEYLPPTNPTQPKTNRNLYLRWHGKGTGQRLILQTHIDTVSWEGWGQGVCPSWDGTQIIGRGACDAKGQIAVLYQLARLLGGQEFVPNGDLEIQIVTQEETGGNGALAAVLQRPSAEGVIVLEPTQLVCYSANRGALWFEIEVLGKATHMGVKWEGVNAIEKTCTIIGMLAEYERALVAESLHIPLFEQYDHPAQVNVGVIDGGEWPSMVPDRCRIEGGVGFLPNKSRPIIQQELQTMLSECPDEWIRQHSAVRFERLKNEAFVTSSETALVKTFSKVLSENGLGSRPQGWNVSCDARLYATVGKMPTVVFGAGNIAHAHAMGESIAIHEIVRAAELLSAMVARWFQNKD